MITGGWRGPGWRVFDAHPEDVRQVRGWICAAITRHDCPVDPQDAALAVSELFTNAVVHGPAGGRVLVGYCLWSKGARIVVCDGGGSGVPELRQVTSQAEGGRGLHVVDSVTARWGSFRLDGNLVAWCDFGQPLRAPASDSWAWLDCVLSAEAHLSVPARQCTAPAAEQATTGPMIPVSAASPRVTAGRSGVPLPSARTSPCAAVPDALPARKPSHLGFPVPLPCQVHHGPQQRRTGGNRSA